MNASPAASSPVSLRSRRSLRFWIFFIFVGFLVLTIVSISLVRSFGIPWLGISGLYQDMEKTEIEFLQLVADLKKEHLEMWLQERESDMNVLAENSFARRDISKICQAARGGVQAADLVAMPEYRNIESAFKRTVHNYPPFEVLHLVDGVSGLILVSSDRQFLGRRPEGEAKFKAFMASFMHSGTWFVAGNGPRDNHVKIALLVPEEDGGDDPVAAIVSRISIEEMLLPMLSSGKGFGKSGEVFLVDRSRQLLTPLRHPLPEGKAARLGEYRIEGLTAFLASEGGEGVVYSVDYRGVPVLESFRHIKVGSGLGWGMIVKQDKSELLAPVRQRLILSSGIGLTGLLIAFIFSGLIARRLVAPLRILTQATSGLSSGDYSQMIPQVNDYREVRELSIAFNMITALNQELASKTLLLTEELTERKQAEKELQKVSLIVQQSFEGIAVADLEGNLLFVNSAWIRMHGFETEEELIGKSLNMFHNREQLENDVIPFNQKVMENGFHSDEVGHIRKDGTSFPTLMNTTLIKDEHGKPSAIAGIAKDITESKRFEEEKIRLEEQYHQAQKVESIGRLAGGVAHDLNNLLTPILGYSEMLIDDLGPDDKRRESVGEILKAGFRARDLVRQLLAFSRKQTLEYRPVDLNIALSGFEKLLRRTIREDIEIEIIPSPDIHTVMADIGQIEQVIMNLAVNAQDAMPKGGRLTIETATADLDELYAASHHGVKPGAYIMLAISDTGCGMDDETREHIFEPFFSTKGELGTGMGLATVYGIVKQQGGNIWVYSEPGKGSTFKIYLPVSGEEHVEEEPGESTSADLGGSETILLVEDEEQVRDLAHAILKQQGYTVLVAEDGPEALTVLAAHNDPVDLLLTDVVMPGMNGRFLFAKVSEQQPGIKVLYMSGYTDDTIAHHGVLHKGAAFIQKPFNVQALAAKVREVLDQGIDG